MLIRYNLKKKLVKLNPAEHAVQMVKNNGLDVPQ